MKKKNKKNEVVTDKKKIQLLMFVGHEGKDE